MNKKVLIAMEFLITYLWAILAVLVAIGALAFFGIINPKQFAPSESRNETLDNQTMNAFCAKFNQKLDYYSYFSIEEYYFFTCYALIDLNGSRFELRTEDNQELRYYPK